MTCDIVKYAIFLSSQKNMYITPVSQVFHCFPFNSRTSDDAPYVTPDDTSNQIITLPNQIFSS